jgi:predicted AAA+ superfamily ATPase
MMYIKRKIEKEILRDLKSFPAICILGPRQCGKTTLVKNLIKHIRKKVTYLDLEHSDDVQKLSQPVMFLEHRKNECVVIDEVQRIPDIFPLIRALIDQKRVPARFIITGSADPTLVRYASESLAGRVVYVNLSPFNVAEISAESNMIEHWVRGGFPKSILAANEEQSLIWRRSFISAYVERDLRILGLDVEPKTMEKLWTMIAHYHSGILNYSDFANAMNLSVPTIKRYFDFLEGAFIIRRLHPFFTNIGKRLIKSPRIYIRDSGILHQLLNINSYDDLQGYVQIGNSWEGYVIEQISQFLPWNTQIYYYRTQAGTEADLVICKGLKPDMMIEIKYGSYGKVNKSLAVAMKDLKPKQRFIIIPRDEDYPASNDVTVCGLEVFLKKYLPGI